MGVVSTKTAEHYVWGGSCDGWHMLRRDEFSVIQERMPPQTSEVEHYHARSRQLFFVLSGTLSILQDGALHVLETEHGLEIPPKSTHRVFNHTASDVRFIVISVPPSHGDKIITGTSGSRR